MADKEKKEETEEEQPAQEKKSSNMLMIIIIVVLILIIIIGAVVAFLLMGNDEEDATKNVPKQEKVQQVNTQQQTRSSSSMNTGAVRPLSEIGTLYQLDPFTVNLKSDSGRRYLKTTISLELEGEELSTELDAKKDVLRSAIILILTSKTLEEVQSRKGKQKLIQQIMDTLNSMITDGKIKGIYFTEFVIQ